MKESERQSVSPIDKFLASDNLPPVIKLNKILATDRDDADNFVKITVEDNDHGFPYEHVSEFFLTENGKPIVSRHIGYTPYTLPYPHCLISGTGGDINYEIHQETGTYFQDDFDAPFKRRDLRFALYFFPLGQDLSANVFVNYNTIEHSGQPSELWFGYSDGKHYDKWSEAEKYRGHVHCKFLPEEEAGITAKHGESLPSQSPLYGIDKEGNIHRFKITSPDSARQITVSFSDFIDINDWDNKIGAQDRSWKDLWKEMPIRLEVKMDWY